MICWRRVRLPTPVFLGFPSGSAGKESACNAEDLQCGRSPGEGKGYPLEYSGLENSMDYIVHGVTKSRTQLSNFHFHATTETQRRQINVKKKKKKKQVCERRQNWIKFSLLKNSIYFFEQKSWNFHHSATEMDLHSTDDMKSCFRTTPRKYIKELQIWKGKESWPAFLSFIKGH